MAGTAEIEPPKPNMLKRFAKTTSLLHGRPDATNHGGAGGGGDGSGGSGGREPRNMLGRRRSLTLDRAFDGVFSSGGKSAAETPTRGVASARKHSPKVLLQSAAAVLNRTHSARKKEAAVAAAAAAATTAAGADPPPKDVALLMGSGMTPDSALDRSADSEPSDGGSLGGRASGTPADVIGVVDLDFFGSPSTPALTSPDAPPPSLAWPGTEVCEEVARGPEGIQEDLCNPKVDAPEGEPIEARLEMWELRAQQ